MNYTDYKTFHESYMKNNHGSSAVHTFFCIFFTVQCTLLCAIKPKTNKPSAYGFEYLIIVLPLILVHTILADYIYQLNALLATILMFSIIHQRSFLYSDEVYNKSEKVQEKRIHSITCIRGLTYLITSMCILAVDFKDFPRYLAKTENYGYSLMDTGVGLFVLISGLVHKDLRTNSLSKIMKSNLKFVSILLMLGISRYVSIKQLDYHQHVTEYGVHWNFFFTLAFCKLFSTIILLFSNRTLLLSISILSAHEMLLYCGLQNWVFSGTSRLSLLDANREGISSNMGYIFLYIFAVHLKTMLSKGNFSWVIKKLIKYAAVVTILSYTVNELRPTSRTLSNAGYCLFLTAMLLIIFTFMYFLETMFIKNKMHFQTPLILIAINNNGLFYFLLCNLLTGLINILFQTLLLTSSVTFVILNVYMIITLMITEFLNRCGIKI